MASQATISTSQCKLKVQNLTCVVIPLGASPRGGVARELPASRCFTQLPIWLVERERWAAVNEQKTQCMLLVGFHVQTGYCEHRALKLVYSIFFFFQISVLSMFSVLSNIKMVVCFYCCANLFSKTVLEKFFALKNC